MSSLNNAAGLLGTAIGFVVLAQGIKLVSDATKHAYIRNGYKVHPMHKLKHHMKKGHKIINRKSFTKRSGLIHQKGIKLPNLNIKSYI